MHLKRNKIKFMGFIMSMTFNFTHLYIFVKTAIDFNGKLELSENLTIAPLLSFFCRVKKISQTRTVNIDAHTKFGLIMSILSHDIERKRNSDLNKGP